MKKHPPAEATVRARKLRSAATPAEQRMWRMLRENFPQGRWRRQVPLRHYIADFASHSLRLVVEVDGGQHSDDQDAARTRFIESEGYQVIRFWNNDVLENAAGCMIRLQELTGQDAPPSNCD